MERIFVFKTCIIEILFVSRTRAGAPISKAQPEDNLSYFGFNQTFCIPLQLGDTAILATFLKKSYFTQIFRPKMGVFCRFILNIP